LIPDSLAFVFYELALQWERRLPFLFGVKDTKSLLFISASRRTIDLIMEVCLHGWSAHKARLAMREVKKQSRAIRELWEAEDSESLKPIFSEDEDGSMRLRAPWLRD